MSRTEQEIFCRVNHYAKNQLYGHIVKLCTQYIKKTDDTVFNFWRASGLMLSGDLSKARKELSRLKKRKALRGAFLGALVELYKLSDQEEDEEFNDLTSNFEMSKDAMNPSSKIHLSLLYLYLGSSYEAKSLIDEVEEEYEDKYCISAEVKGWVFLLSDREVVTFECESIFDRNYESAILFQLGQAEYFKMKKQYDKSEKVLSKIVVGNSKFHFVQVEKAFLQILQNKWSEANEICLMLLKSKDSKNFDATMIHLVYLITHKNKLKVVNSKFKRLMNIIRVFENRNHKLMYRIAHTFSCIAGHNKLIVEECHGIMQTAIKIHPLDSDYHTLIGYCYLLQKKYIEAEKDFNLALEYDESNVAANMLLIKSLIFQKKFEEAQELLQTLNDVGETLDVENLTLLGSPAELCFLNYLMAVHQSNDRKAGLSQLYETVKLFMKSVNYLEYTINYYSKFNPQFVLEVCREILSYCPQEPIEMYSLPSNELKLFDKILQVLLQTVPGSLDGQYLSAFHFFLTNRSAEAYKLAELCCQLDPSFAPAYLLQAEIAFRRGQFQVSHSTLTRVLAKNFAVKDRVDYNLLYTKVLIQIDEASKALDVLNTAYTRLKKKKSLSTGKEVEFHLQFCRIFVRLGKRKYAIKHLRKAKPLSLASGEGQERIVFAEVELRVHFGEISPALHMLEGIPKSSKRYKEAIRMRAKIYLDHLKNPNQYILLFEELVKQEETKENLLELGGAYIGVHEPEKAITLFQRALKLDPKNYHIMNLIGEAFVTTHRFREAIQYYKTALKENPGEFQLQMDLTNLYITLKMYKEAHDLVTETRKIIEEGGVVSKKKKKSEEEEEDDDPSSERMKSVSGGKKNPFFIKQLVQTLLKLSEIEEGKSDLVAALATMEKAISLQDSLLIQTRGLEEEERAGRGVMADLYFRMYEMEKRGDNRSLLMIGHLNNVIKHNPKRSNVYCVVARLHLSRGDILSAEKNAERGISVDPKSEDLMLCLTDIKFQKRRFGEATRYIQKILSKYPRNYIVLEKYIQLLRRFGDLSQCEKYLELAESDDPGYHYCCGVYLKFLGCLNEANLELLKARNSDQWFEKATFHMVEIYLSLELNFLNPWASIGTKLNRKNVESANALLKKLLEIRDKLKYHPKEKLFLYQAYSLIAIGKVDKSYVEKALKLLQKSRKKKQPNIAIQLGIATSYIIAQMDSRIKRTLKGGLRGVEEYEEYYEELERCRLIMANFSVRKGDVEEARKVLEQVIKDNRSCVQAHELLGTIHEKNQKFEAAAKSYEKAWFLSNERSTVVGFKLAFNYLKGKKYASAIQICHKVLRVDPNYPKIRTEILKKARAKLRP